jgi:hypothetical protein
MNILLRTLLTTAIAFSISCSKGGADDAPTGNAPGTPAGNKPADNTQFKNVPNSIQGQWSDGGALTLFVSDTKLKLVAQCENQQVVQVEIAIKLTPTDFTFLESKSAGQGDCSIDFKQGMVTKYSVNGDRLTIMPDAQKQIAFERLQNLPQQPTPSNPGNGGGNGAITLELFSGANCQGTKVIYTVGMNCTQISGTVNSLRQAGQQQCTNTNQPLQAAQVCESVNQQAAGQ